MMKKILLTVLLAVATTIAFQLINISPAYANWQTDTGTNIIGDDRTFPPPKGGGDGGGGTYDGVPSSGGPTWHLPASNCFYQSGGRWVRTSSNTPAVTSTCIVPYSGRSSSNSKYYWWKTPNLYMHRVVPANRIVNGPGADSITIYVPCAPRNGVPAVRVDWKFSHENGKHRTIPAGRYIEHTCVYPEPPKPYVKQTWECATTWTSSLYQSSTKNGILNGGSMPQGASSPNPRSGRFQSSSQCPGGGERIPPSGIQINISFNLNSPENGGYGYYRQDLLANKKTCGVRGIAGTTSQDVIFCESGTSQQRTSTYYVSSCDYTFTRFTSWNPLPNNVNFALDACVTFTCVVDGRLRINDTQASIQVMRNGEPVKVSYPQITVQADPANMKPSGTTWNIQAATGVISSSTPYNTNVDINSSKQYFSLHRGWNATNPNNFGVRQNFIKSRQDSATNGAWETQNQTTDTIRFYWASDSETGVSTNKAFRLYRAYRIVDAQFLVKSPSNTNDYSGNRSWQRKTVYCGYAQSNHVTVVRGANQ
jgi:hypothetical protein